MKQTLRILSRFILSALLLILVLASLVVLSRFVSGFDPDRGTSDTLLVQLIDATREVAAISILIAAALALFATIRSMERPFFVLLLLAGSWTVLLMLAALFWPSRASEAPDFVLPEQQIVRISNTDIYALDVQGTSAETVVYHQPGARPGTELIGQAVIDPDDGVLSVPGRDDLTLQLSEVETSYPSMTVPPERVSRLIRDIRAFNTVLAGGADSESSTSLLLVVAVGLFILSCWAPARLTRWPLFNAVFVFLIIRGALWLVYSLHFGELGRLVGGAVQTGNLGLLTSGVLAFVAAVFLFLLFLLPPLSEWKRELVHE